MVVALIIAILLLPICSAASAYAVYRLLRPVTPVPKAPEQEPDPLDMHPDPPAPVTTTQAVLANTQLLNEWLNGPDRKETR